MAAGPGYFDNENEAARKIGNNQRYLSMERCALANNSNHVCLWSSTKTVVVRHCGTKTSKLWRVPRQLRIMAVAALVELTKKPPAGARPSPPDVSTHSGHPIVLPETISSSGGATASYCGPTAANSCLLPDCAADWIKNSFDSLEVNRSAGTLNRNCR